jgi:mRNA interferase RelE/StbE
MKIRKEEQFNRDFARLPKELQNRAENKLALFLQNPRHPSLGTKKMEGNKNIWEGCITKAYRFFFRIEKDTYVLLNIGPHDIERRY